ncbi:MAG: hypothetical protein ACFFE2_08665 [Candidatus Thorarchaeota archaeon]
MSSREQEIAKIAKMYTRYLNGPLGRGVMDHLKEGESFTIRSQEEMLEIFKEKGKAVVKILDNPQPNSTNSADSVSQHHHG